MKISFYLPVAAFFLFSCSRQKTEISSPINKEKIKEVRASSSRYSTRVDMYSVLTAQEKADLWQSQLDSFYLGASLDATQQEVIDSIKAYISASIFLDSNRQKISGDVAQLEYKARNAFSDKNYYLIFEIWGSSPSEYDKYAPLSTTLDPGTGTGNTCYCRSDSYCGRMMGNDLATCIWSSCADSNGGCGFLGFYDCHGKCYLGSHEM